MADLTELHRVAAEARAVRDETREALRRSSLRLQSVDEELARARRTSIGEQDPHAVAELERERASLVAAVSDGRQGLVAARDRVVGDVGRFFADLPGLVSQLDDAAPFLLFPVRIETKFAAGQQGTELLVRIFPDDIAIAHHEKDLTVGEKEAGEKYWRARASANAQE